MRRFLLTGCAVLGLASVAGAAAPAVSLERAIELAREQLRIRGLDGKVYIESVSLEAGSMLASSKHWTVLWSEWIPTESGRMETGVEVDMRGTVLRLVKASGGGSSSKPRR